MEIIPLEVWLESCGFMKEIFIFHHMLLWIIHFILSNIYNFIIFKTTNIYVHRIKEKLLMLISDKYAINFLYKSRKINS